MSLYSELKRAAFDVTPLHVQFLNGLGASWETIGELGRHHYSFGVAHVSPADEPGLYIPGEGDLHLILPVYDQGELVDLGAFKSSDPGNWLLRSGLGWALGLERGLERHRWADRVDLVASPLDWLRQGATALCVLDWDAPEVAYLADFPNIACSDARLASTLRQALLKPQRLPNISIGGTSLAA